MRNINFNDIWKDRSFRLSILISSIFLSIGFALLHLGLVGYGWAFFVLLPIVVGMAIGALPNRKNALPGLVLTVLLFIVILIQVGLEGVVCVIFCLPILIPFFFLGAIISHLVKKYRQIKHELNLKLTLLPFLVFVLAVPVEQKLTDNKPKVIEVSDEIILPYSPIQVFDAIKSVDTLIAEKPFLMRLDLPVPYKCLLEKEEVGALRICYFEGGRIVERITAYEPGKLLKMDVIDYELTGRKWLGFKEAIYFFEAIGTDSCRMTRTTTYTSELYPRRYWQPFEEVGIRQEHQYVFNNLKRDLRENISDTYGNR